jgi:aminocarboxymuconate-semialdehyde decarboxylase
LEPIALDIHTHLVPVDEAALAVIDGVTWDAASTALVVDGHKVGMKPLYAPEALIAWLDANAIGAAWFAAPPPLYRQHLSEDSSLRWVNYVNGGLADIARRFTGRLTALPHLPIEHPDVAAEVAAHAIATGQRRFSSPSGGPHCALSDKAYDPLWRALNGVSAFVLVHPGENDDPRLTPFYLTNLLGNPYETTIAIAHLIFGGVIARYPNITFCFAHGGGAAPILAGRFEQGFRTDRPGIDTSLPSPRSLLKRLIVDCVMHDVDALYLAEAVFGPSHILFGSDWPFPMGTMLPHEKLAALDPETRKRICQDNLAPFLT